MNSGILGNSGDRKWIGWK